MTRWIVGLELERLGLWVIKYCKLISLITNVVIFFKGVVLDGQCYHFSSIIVFTLFLAASIDLPSTLAYQTSEYCVSIIMSLCIPILTPH